MVWYFIGVYIINRTLHGRSEIRNFSSLVKKYFTRSLRSLVKYFSALEKKFRISARPCNILYISYHAAKNRNICKSIQTMAKNRNVFTVIQQIQSVEKKRCRPAEIQFHHLCDSVANAVALSYKGS